MSGSVIAWSAFSWEAFATLTTGVLAVSAAVFVGFRQAEIQRRQVEIQESAHRWELFDRRYRVFEVTEKFLREILLDGDDPSAETQQEFLLAKGESRFLFRPDVERGLEEIWNRWSSFHQYKRLAEESYRVSRREDERYPEKVREENSWFTERFATLAELFDDLQPSETK